MKNKPKPTINQQNNPPTNQAQQTNAQPLTTTSPPYTILLAEDNEINITIFSKYLQTKNYHMLIARNGKESIEQAQNNHPHLILMDIQMPGMDGLEAIHYLRNSQDPYLRTIPIIALTALAKPKDRQRCLDVGANEYATKPISLKNLLTLIEMYLK